jgi:hypothetical protein
MRRLMRTMRLLLLLLLLLRLIAQDAVEYIQENTLKTLWVFSVSCGVCKILYEASYDATRGNDYDSWVVGFHAAELTCIAGAACCLLAALSPIWQDYRNRMGP